MTDCDEDWDWWAERLMGDRKNSGYVVDTKSGRGRTYHSEEPINGKVAVHLNDGRKILASEENITVVGFID